MEAIPRAAIRLALLLLAAPGVGAQTLAKQVLSLAAAEKIAAAAADEAIAIDGANVFR